MLENILLVGYITTAFMAILFISIAIPRIAKFDSNKPTYIYIGFYIINSLILNFVFRLHPGKTIATNLLLLAFAQIIGIKLRFIGLTGAICSGKTTVAHYLHQRHNATVIEVDRLNRQVGKLLLWTMIKEKLCKNTKYVIIENALLLRFNFLTLFCFPILAICTNSHETLLERVMERDSCDRTTAEELLGNQMKLEEYILQSDTVIFNDLTVDELKYEVEKFMSKTFG